MRPRVPLERLFTEKDLERIHTLLRERERAERALARLVELEQQLKEIRETRQ